MPRWLRLAVMTALMVTGVRFCFVGRAEERAKPANPALPPEISLYAGSKSCIECHGKFYQLWASSRHGLAMQPYTPEFARAHLTPQKKDLVIGKERYRAYIGHKAGWVLETDPKGKEKKYLILHALGGKDVYYFLTPLERGRLQTLPVAYDGRARQWFDTAASGMRHFDSSPPGDLHRRYVYAQRDGLDYNLADIPQDYSGTPKSKFAKAYMNQLVDYAITWPRPVIPGASIRRTSVLPERGPGDFDREIHHG
jgi:hypothetical protein